MNPGCMSSLAAGLAGSSLRVGTRLVLLSLAASTGKDGIARIGHAKLASRCGMSVSTVRRHLRALTSSGRVTVHARPGGVNHYGVSVHSGEQGVCSSSEQGGGHSGEQGGGHPGEQRSSTYLVHTSGNRPRLGDPTPRNRHQVPVDGRPLAEYLAGASWRDALAGQEGGKHDEDTSAVATVDERATYADTKPDGPQPVDLVA